MKKIGITKIDRVHFFLIRFFEHIILESKFERWVENSELQITKNTEL